MDEFDKLCGDGANRKTGVQVIIIVALFTVLLIAALARVLGGAVMTRCAAAPERGQVAWPCQHNPR